MKRLAFLVTISPLALVAAGAALAADIYVPPPIVPGPIVAPAPNLWADLTLAGGWEQTIDTYWECSDLAGSVLAGEGRFGIQTSPNASLQFDVHGTSDAMRGIGCSSDEDYAAVFGAAAHLTFGSGNSGIGGMIAASSWQETPRWYTLAAEGFFGGPSTRVVLQGGWSFQRAEGETFDAPYIHAVIQHSFSPTLMLSGNVGYAAPDTDDGRESVWRYGAKLENAFSPVVTGFVEWQGIWRKEGENECCVDHDRDDITHNNRVMVGVSLHLNNGGNPMAASPLHDFSWPAGVNNQFEF